MQKINLKLTIAQFLENASVFIINNIKNYKKLQLELREIQIRLILLPEV